MYQRQEGYFRGFNDFELFYQSWIRDEAKGAVVVTHGLGEHSECYMRLASGISDSQCNIYGWDLRGHGRSEGKRGVIRQFLDYCEDLRAFYEFVRKIESGPVFLLGHSMGGLITSRTVLEYEELGHSGVILSSPLMGIAVEVNKLKEMGGKIAAKWFPELTLNNEISYPQLTRDREIIQEYQHDPLRHDKISTKLFVEMIETMAFCLDHAVQIEQPILVMQAGHDTVVSPDATKDFYNKMSSKDKSFHLYEGYYHEIFNDLGRERVFKDLLAWLMPRLAGGK